MVTGMVLFFMCLATMWMIVNVINYNHKNYVGFFYMIMVFGLDIGLFYTMSRLYNYYVYDKNKGKKECS